MLIFVYGDIVDVPADVVGIAANAKGTMGGWFGRYVRLKGVAEGLNYATHGAIEKEAKRIARRDKPGLGDVYITGAYDLPARWVVHAVTRLKPGQRSSLEIVGRCVEHVVGTCRMLGAKKVALPLLGTETEGLETKDVEALYEGTLGKMEDLQIMVVRPQTERYRG